MMVHCVVSASVAPGFFMVHAVVIDIQLVTKILATLLKTTVMNWSCKEDEQYIKLSSGKYYDLNVCSKH